MKGPIRDVPALSYFPHVKNSTSIPIHRFREQPYSIHTKWSVAYARFSYYYKERQHSSFAFGHAIPIYMGRNSKRFFESWWKWGEKRLFIGGYGVEWKIGRKFEAVFFFAWALHRLYKNEGKKAFWGPYLYIGSWILLKWAYKCVFYGCVRSIRVMGCTDRGKVVWRFRCRFFWFI